MFRSKNKASFFSKKPSSGWAEGARWRRAQNWASSVEGETSMFRSLKGRSFLLFKPIADGKRVKIGIERKLRDEHKLGRKRLTKEKWDLREVSAVALRPHLVFGFFGYRQKTPKESTTPQ